MRLERFRESAKQVGEANKRIQMEEASGRVEMEGVTGTKTAPARIAGQSLHSKDSTRRMHRQHVRESSDERRPLSAGGAE